MDPKITGVNLYKCLSQGSNVLFSILFVTIDPQLDGCIMYSVYPSEQVKLFIYNYNEPQSEVC